MIELREYARLLGYPPGKELDGAVLARARESMNWYDRHGRPRVFVRDDAFAITAGPEVEREIAARWRADRVDEAYFLDRFAAGVVEHLARSIGHTSPGYRGWEIADQRVLMDRLGVGAPVELLPSGMLRPVHSLLGVVTGELSSCRDCDFRCSFRRIA